MSETKDLTTNQIIELRHALEEMVAASVDDRGSCLYCEQDAARHRRGCAVAEAEKALKRFE